VPLLVEASQVAFKVGLRDAHPSPVSPNGLGELATVYHHPQGPVGDSEAAANLCDGQ
jgi:hypothetical protein